MPLSNSCLEYAGRIVYVHPIYGWGWNRIDVDAQSSDPVHLIVPSAFRLRLLEFYYFHETLYGSIARVEELGHIYDNLYAVFYTSDANIDDFTDKLGNYNIQLGVGEPTLSNPQTEDEADWPRWIFLGSSWFSGYAVIGTSYERVAQYLQEI